MKLLFWSLDFNQDGRICEWDLFKAVNASMENNRFLNMLNDDVLVILNKLNTKKKELGKTDSLKISISK